MSLSLYFDRARQVDRPRIFRSTRLADSVYANVIVDIQAKELKDKLFTYRVPADLTEETFIGAQVLVPFGGRDLVGGFVVSLSDKPNGDRLFKEIAEVIEPEPFFDKDYVQFLYWIAEYYCSSLSDVISAAVPSVLNPKVKRIVQLNRDAYERRSGGLASYERCAQSILGALLESKTGALAMVALKQRCRRTGKLTISQIYRTMNLLRQEGLLTVVQESGVTQAPRTVTTVIWNGGEGDNARQKELISILSRNGGQMTLKSLLEEGKTTAATVKKLAQSGLFSIIQLESVRDPLSQMEAGISTSDLTLTEAQRHALAVLEQELERTLKLRSGQPTDSDTDAAASAEAGAISEREAQSPWLLFGVTGSGKTEIYLRLIEKALLAGRTAMLLVPEISLTPQLARRLKSRFGDLVAVWHSGLSAGERYDTWRRLRSGAAKVLLGARSAILANLPDLSLIILDEEHDGSYKQTSPNPRYNAKEVALEKARRLGALVLFGSATPDVAVYQSALKAGRVLELPERVFKQQMPRVRIVDMRAEFSRGHKGIFSAILEAELEACLSRKEQAILLINRRGYASHVFCRACGFVVKCKNCSVALVFHQRPGAKQAYLDGFLACHHCGFRCGAVDKCGNCASPFIKQYGLGTQRVEEEVRELFSDAKILRLDSDVTVRKGSHDEILQSFARGEADVLIGTQMVAKGLDIANVTLVGVMTADAAFNLPDYRSTERGFQLLTQVAGRAGRGDRPGEVILQTYDCEMPALQFAKNHDYASFFADEIEARRAFEYPPFSQIIRLVVAGADPAVVEACCYRIAEEISQFVEDSLPVDAMKVLGPAPCLIERLRGKFRFHLIVKNLAGDSARLMLTTFLRNRNLPAGLQMAVDVDALDLV